MQFYTQQYSIEDSPMQPFIDPDEIWNILNNTLSDKEKVLEIINKSLSKQRLSLKEVAVLINAKDPQLIEKIKKGAQTLKKNIYGNRIVLFAPLYIGNKCQNNCTYCGFRSSNKDANRITLNDEQIINEIEALEDAGQKRLILVYGEHEQYSPEFIANSVRVAYSVKKGNGEIRRVNINAAPLEIEGFRTIKNAGIGTYQIFQETYNKEIYKTYHLRGKKADFDYRLTALDRAQEAGLDDVGIGVLFGLYDWRFEVMALVRHTNHLEACYNVGPHTISFPRVKDASMLEMGNKYFVSDDDFMRLVAILRLAVPYTGMILTAREPAELRNELLQFGVSQIDGGTKIELGAYAKNASEQSGRDFESHSDCSWLDTSPPPVQNLNKGQFRINDGRSLNEIIDELISQEMIPSFCTSCYRMGRTGEHFMEFSVPGFIKRFCTPNAILTFAEYLCDYAHDETQVKGWNLIEKELKTLNDPALVNKINNKLLNIRNGKRDVYF